MRQPLILLLALTLTLCACPGLQAQDTPEPTGLDFLNAAREAEAGGHPMQALFLAGKAAGFSFFVDVSDEEYPPLLEAGTAEHEEALEIIEHNRGSLLWSSPFHTIQHYGCIDSWYPECVGVERLSWSPDDSRILSNGMFFEARIWDVATGSMLYKSDSESLHNISGYWSSNGEYIIIHDTQFIDSSEYEYPVSSDSRVSILNAETYSSIVQSDNNNTWINAYFSPDNKFLLMSNTDNETSVWDLSNLSVIRTWFGNTSALWSPDGKRIATWGENDTVRIFDFISGELIQEFDTAPDSVQYLYWVDEGKTLVIVFYLQKHTLWNVESGEMLRVLVESEHGLVSASPDGEKIAVKERDALVTLVSAETGEETHVLMNTENVDCMSWNHDGTIVACATQSEIMFFNSVSGELLSHTQNPCIQTWMMKWSCDGRYVCVIGWGMKMYIVDLHAGERVYAIQLLNGPVRCVAWDHGSTTLAYGDFSGYINYFHLDAEVDQQPTSIPTGNTLSIDWSPDGQRIVSGGRDGVIRIWNAESGALLSAFRSDSAEISCVAWSHDGTYIAVGMGSSVDDDGMFGDPVAQHCPVTIWDTGNAALIKTLSVDGDVYSIAWSHDNKYIALGQDKSVIVWDVLHDACIARLQGVRRFALHFSWSPDGAHIAASGGHNENAVHVWDATSGELIATLDGQMDMSWSPDGNSLATLAYAGEVNIWDVDTGALIQAISEEGRFQDIAWAPTENRIAATYGEGIAIINLIDASRVQTLESPLGYYGDLNWSPDGTRLARDGVTMGVWDLSGNASGKFNADILRFVRFEGTSVSFIHPLGNIGEVLSILRQ